MSQQNFLLPLKPKHARPSTKADETPEFVEFWTLWQPVKSEYDGRALARDGFFQHVWWRGAAPQDIVDGARFYVHNFKPGQFRMKAAEWLSRGHYEDDCEKWRAFQARQAEQSQRANVVSIGPRGQTAFLKQWSGQ